MIQKFLCFWGFHKYKFLSNYEPIHDQSLPLAGLWRCNCCGKRYWQWYEWIKVKKLKTKFGISCDVLKNK